MRRIFNKTSINWSNELGVYALNRDTRQFEKCSPAPNLFVEDYYIDEENPFKVNEDEVSDALADFLNNGYDYDFTLYNKCHQLVGFAYFPYVPDRKELP